MSKTAPLAPELASLLSTLMNIRVLSAFNLGGGTSLALRFAHRKSFDLDLFCGRPFDTQAILDALHAASLSAETLNRTAGSLCLEIRGMKVDILLHEYPLLAAPDLLSEARILSIADVAAMKINAVTNRGSKKDFSDLLTLSEHGWPFEKALDAFCRKYGSAGRFLAIRSLCWFNDAEEEPDPVYLNGWTWQEVRGRCQKAAKALVSG